MRACALPLDSLSVHSDTRHQMQRQAQDSPLSTASKREHKQHTAVRLLAHSGPFVPAHALRLQPPLHRDDHAKTTTGSARWCTMLHTAGTPHTPARAAATHALHAPAQTRGSTPQWATMHTGGQRVRLPRTPQRPPLTPRRAAARRGAPRCTRGTARTAGRTSCTPRGGRSRGTRRCAAAPCRSCTLPARQAQGHAG